MKNPGRFPPWQVVGWLFAWLALAGPATAQQLIVGAGASLNLGNATVDVGCRDLTISGALDVGAGSLTSARDFTATGTLRGGTGSISLSRDLNAAAALIPQTGSLRIGDGCGSTQSRVVGNHQFYRFIVQATTSHALLLPAGGTQFIANHLDLLGGTQRLLLRSSAAGTVGYLELAAGGGQSISRVDVQDVGAPLTGQYLAPGPPAFYDSIDQGNTPRFFGDQELRPVPALSAIGLLLLVLTMLALAAVHLRPRD
jgi:hypothetical protein